MAIKIVKDSIISSCEIGNKYFGIGLHRIDPYHNKLVIRVAFWDIKDDYYTYTFIVKPKKNRTIFLAEYHKWIGRQDRIASFFCRQDAKSYNSYIAASDWTTKKISGKKVIKNIPKLVENIVVQEWYRNGFSTALKSIKSL